MQKWFSCLNLIFVLTILILSSCQQTEEQVVKTQSGTEKLADKAIPSDEFFVQRSWPDGQFSIDAYARGLEQARQDKISIQFASMAKGGGAAWLQEGPTNVQGRINTIAVDPTDTDVMYIGAATGGVFKTTDGGANWLPIFDDQAFLAIGDIEIDPNDNNTIYVGTGDPNLTGFPFVGDGVWKSTDAGATWTNMGLINQRVITRILVHPLNSNLIYAGAMGLPFEPNSDRGLYKSIDGGLNWNQILYLSDSAGIIDFVIDPTDPDRVWAAGWNRIRNNFESIIRGDEARIYRTTDGGANWTTLGGGLPTGELTRIGLSQHPTDPNTIVAQYISPVDFSTLGIYKTVDGGNNWSEIPSTDVGSLGNFGWYFGKIRINPFDASRMYVCGVRMWYSDDEGINWNERFSGSHSDKHDLVFLSANTLIMATDGGMYKSTNNGNSWTVLGNIPNTQFYHITVNPHISGDYWGGAQDNGTNRGGISAPGSWDHMFGGDGFHVAFQTNDPDVVYAETQNGNIVKSFDGGYSFFSGSDGLDGLDRRNWDMPFIISPHDPERVYAGTYRMYESNGASVFFNP
ncbi:MAG: photosystem II stability/assembly factor-like uncharacterized protein, partial [Limisphaerales bacterium]